MPSVSKCRLRRIHQQHDAQHPQCGRGPRHDRRLFPAHPPRQHQDHQRLRGIEDGRQPARQSIGRHEQHGLKEGNVQDGQHQQPPHVAPAWPFPCPGQQQQSGRKHAQQRGSEGAAKGQEFGRDQIGAAPDEWGQRRGQDHHDRAFSISLQGTPRQSGKDMPILFLRLAPTPCRTPSPGARDSRTGSTRPADSSPRRCR